MKTIIAGSRNVVDETIVRDAVLSSGFTITEVVSGGALGVDTIGERLAIEKHLPVERFIPDWDEHGRAAGPIRNRKMAAYADQLVAVWDGESKGTKNMIKEMKRVGKPIFIFFIREPDVSS